MTVSIGADNKCGGQRHSRAVVWLERIHLVLARRLLPWVWLDDAACGAHQIVWNRSGVGGLGKGIACSGREGLSRYG